MLLLYAAKEAILPYTLLQILDVLSAIGSCLQMNGETVESFGTQVEHLFIRLKNLSALLSNNYNWRHYNVDSSMEHILIMNH